MMTTDQPQAQTLGDDVKAHLSQGSEVVFSFDTTGSMYPCLDAVRRDVSKTCRDLFGLFPDLKIGLISHGDYCDGQNRINSLNLTGDQDAIGRFIQETPRTGGGDAPECYELALHTALGMNWITPKGRMLVLIGDDEPHSPHYPGNDLKLDWRQVLMALKEQGVKVFPIQCLYHQRRGVVNRFWEEVAEISGTRLFRFHQGEDFEKTSTPVVAGMVAAAYGSEEYERYARSPIGMVNNSNLSASMVSGMMCAARGFNPKGSPLDEEPAKDDSK